MLSPAVDLRSWARKEFEADVSPFDILSARSIHELAQKIVHTSALGQHFIIINSVRIAVDLLDKRGAIYSDRPPLLSAGLIGYFDVTPAAPYGEPFKEHRKMLSQTIGTRSHVERMMPLTVAEVRRLLMRLVNSPEHFVGHIRRYVSSFVHETRLL